MTIVVEGLDEAQDYLGEVEQRAAGDWEAFTDLALKLLRYGVSISPVLTGSYAGSHRATTVGKATTLAIAPLARNVKTGTLVSRYAGAVEARHQVYGKIGNEGNRLAVSVAEEIADEVAG